MCVYASTIYLDFAMGSNVFPVAYQEVQVSYCTSIVFIVWLALEVFIYTHTSTHIHL